MADHIENVTAHNTAEILLLGAMVDYCPDAEDIRKVFKMTEPNGLDVNVSLVVNGGGDSVS